MQREATRSDIRRRAGEAFQADALAAPTKTLRGGYAEDSYDIAPPPDPVLDALTDEYLETYTFWGFAYLDPASWRHYLPRLIDYALGHMDDPKMAVEGLLHNLRPPDRDPPRLASLTAEQEAVIVAFLEEVAFSEDSANRNFAMQVLEEWWIPGALYRK
ncbi:MAG: hypothetical protein PHX38_06940 [Sulfuricella sp.]|nr:hypothetical protein [Sulfuricella sp.]